MKIITHPHPSLRTIAQPVVTVDKQLRKFIQDLKNTLQQASNPQGVGLAATQVNAKRRIFATLLDHQLRAFINPEIIDHDNKTTLGPKKDDPYLEGCLSIPGIYGPVPRYGTIKLQFQTISGNDLVSQIEIFDDFAARVVQHEFDHLNGVLFIDYTKRLDLPLYQEDKNTKKLNQLEPSIVDIL